MSDADVSYRPDVPAAFATAHRLSFVGRVFALIVYGLTISIFASCVRALSPSALGRQTSRSTAVKKFQLLYVCAIFICGSLFVVADVFENTVSTLDYPLYPGGSFAWVLDNYNHPVIILGNTAFVLTTWLADGFMLYRIFVLYSTTLYIVVLPALVYLASVATGILLLVQAAQPDQSLFSQVNFGLAYFSTTAALNMFITALISGRLVFHRFAMQKAMSIESNSLKTYVSVTAILIESSALYAIVFLAFIVPFAMDHPMAKFVLPILAQVQVICPLLVTYRISRQRAWTTTTGQSTTATTSVRFRPDLGRNVPGTDSRTFIDSGDRIDRGTVVHLKVEKVTAI